MPGQRTAPCTQPRSRTDCALARNGRRKTARNAHAQHHSKIAGARARTSGCKGCARAGSGNARAAQRGRPSRKRAGPSPLPRALAPARAHAQVCECAGQRGAESGRARSQSPARAGRHGNWVSQQSVCSLWALGRISVGCGWRLAPWGWESPPGRALALASDLRRDSGEALLPRGSRLRCAVAAAACARERPRCGWSACARCRSPWSRPPLPLRSPRRPWQRNATGRRA